MSDSDDAANGSSSLPEGNRSKSILNDLIVLSRRQAVQYRGDAPYVVVSIRSPGDSIPRLQVDPYRIARINLAIHDTTPEWEAISHDPVPTMTIRDAERIATFVLRNWSRCRIVVHCRLGVSRSAGIVAGILDAFSLDATPFERTPYEPNQHFREMVRNALTPYVASPKQAFGE
jgi:predicted protein tyrosine phosphatase